MSTYDTEEKDVAPLVIDNGSGEVFYDNRIQFVVCMSIGRHF